MAADLDIHLPAIAAGDADAFGHWMAAAEPALRRIVRPFAARVDAEAVLQETFLRVWQVAPRVRSEAPNALLRLAIVTAKNLARGELRRVRLEPWEDEALARALADEMDLLPTDAPDPLLRALIHDCHAALPPRPRQAITTRVGAGGGRADRELAEAIGMTLNTFLQNVTRGRKLLADCLEARGVPRSELSA
jgi:RNA polymerase sigma factor (sigma-70 family)